MASLMKGHLLSPVPSPHAFMTEAEAAIEKIIKEESNWTLPRAQFLFFFGEGRLVSFVI